MGIMKYTLGIMSATIYTKICYLILSYILSIYTEGTRRAAL